MNVSQDEMNQYIKNLYNDIGLPSIEKHHANEVTKFLIENLSMIGRYSHRDFERFGNLKYQYAERVEVHGRQDGWQALTKEVPHLDHLTYGNGILYIHGETEIAPDEDDPVDPINNDEAYHVDRKGNQFVYQDTEAYDWWNDDVSSPGSQLPVGEIGPMGLPPIPPLGLGYPEDWTKTDKIEAWKLIIKATAGYRHEWITVEKDDQEGDAASSDGKDKWTWATIKENVYGDGYDPDEDDKYDVGVAVEEKLPPKFNDSDVYNLDNERHHFLFQIVNGAAAKSVDTLLTETLAGNNGMYDGKIPKLAGGEGSSTRGSGGGNWPPKRGGIKYPAGHEVLVDFISPIEETSAAGIDTLTPGEGGETDQSDGSTHSNSGKSGKRYRDAYFFNFGVAVVFPETYPPNQVPPEERRAFYDANLTDDQKYYDDPEYTTRPISEFGEERKADWSYRE